MAIKDVLLPLFGNPSPAVIAAITKCVDVAASFGAEITALAVEEDVSVRPKVMVSTDRELADEMKSTTDAQGLLKAFDAAVVRIGLRNVQRVVHLMAGDAPEHVARCARLKDLSIILVTPDDDGGQRVIKGLIFQSGRPILLCPEELAAKLPGSFDRVIVAWDHSMPAARAVGDSLPVLRRARDVQIITATDANGSAEQQSGAAVIRHLAEHSITATFEMVRIGGSSIGKILEAEV